MRTFVRIPGKLSAAGLWLMAACGARTVTGKGPSRMTGARDAMTRRQLGYGFGSGVSNTRISDTPGGTPALSVALSRNRRPVFDTPAPNKKVGRGEP